MEAEHKRDAVVADLYSTIMLPSGINAAFDKINTWLGTQGVHIVGWDLSRQRVNVSIPIGDQITTAETSYADHYQFLDPRAKFGIDGIPGKIVACHDYCTPSFVRKDEFYQDFLIPHGIRYVLGGNILRDTNTSLLIAFNHLVGNDEFSTEQRSRLSGLMPHLVNWARQLRLADSARTALKVGERALEYFEEGIIALDASGSVIHLNQAARTILEHRIDGKRIRDRIDIRSLALQVTGDSMPRTRMVRTSTDDRYAHLFFTALKLPDEDFPDSTSPAGLDSLISSSMDRETSEHAFTVFPKRPSVLVLIRTRAAHPQSFQRRIGEIFGLTLAESTVACSLLDGKSPQEISEENAVSINTTRTHIRSLLHKTDCRNMTALVLLLSRIPEVP